MSKGARVNRNRQKGFTLIEALLSTMIISVTVMAVSAAFYGVFQSLDDEARLAAKVNYVAAKLDELTATDFDQLSTGSYSDQVTIQGELVDRHWDVYTYDVDHDFASDSDALLIVAWIEDVTFPSVVIDSAGLVTCKR